MRHAWFVVALCLALPAAAGAQLPPQNPEENVTQLRIVQRSLTAGLEHWAERQVSPCPDATVYERVVLIDPASGVHAVELATLGGCTIWVVRDVVIAAQGPWSRLRQISRLDLCSILSHGQGHLANLRFEVHPLGDPYHSLTGLMSPTGGGVIPWRCQVAFPVPR